MGLESEAGRCETVKPFLDLGPRAIRNILVKERYLNPCKMELLLRTDRQIDEKVRKITFPTKKRKCL